MIETIVDKDHNLTIHTCSGDLKIKEVLDAINLFYDGLVTDRTLWDFSKASLSHIPSEDIQKSFKLVEKRGIARQGGKTAIVASNDLGYGLARMFQIMSNTDDFPFTINVFRTVEEAREWVFSEK